MGFRRIFADDGQNDKEKLYKKLSDKVNAREVLGWIDDNIEWYPYNGDTISTSDYVEWLRKNDVCKQGLKDKITEEINILRNNITDKDELTKTVVNTVNNSNKSNDPLSVYSRLYAVLYGEEAYKSILKTALRGNLENDVRNLLVEIQKLNENKTTSGIEKQLQEIQNIINKISDKDIKSLMRKGKEISSSNGKSKKSSITRTAADYKTIGKALVNGLVRATMNVIRDAEKNKGANEEERERLLHGLYNMAGKYLSDSVLKSYKTVLDNTLKQWNQNLPEKNEISKDTSLRDYSIGVLVYIGVFNVENYGLWMLHATEQYNKALGKPLVWIGKGESLKEYLNEQWESRYSEDFKDLVANEAIRLINEDYASNEDFANKWDSYKANSNRNDLEECIGGYIEDAYDSLGSQRMDEYYFGKKFKRIDGKNGKDIKDELLEKVKEELINSVLSN